MKFENTLFLLLLLGGLLACGKKKEQSPSSETTSANQSTQTESNSLLPYSTGKINGLYLYVDPSFQDSELLDTLKYNLLQPYLLTPNPSPVIDVNQYNFSTFESGGTRSANNLMLINVNEESAMSSYVKQQLGTTKVAEAVAGKELALVRVKDVNASPQQIFYLLANGYPNLASKQVQSAIDQYANTIIEESTIIDNKRLVSSFSNSRKRSLENTINNKFGFSLWIPKTYETVIDEPNFLWIIHETNDLYSSIVVYKTDYNPEFSLDEQVLSVRDEFGEKITTDKEGSRMTTSIETKPFPIQRNLTINGKTVLETRGLWKMVNDRLGGGFLNYSWIQNDQIISIDGFVYYAGYEKRRKMRDIDAICSTIQLQD